MLAEGAVADFVADGIGVAGNVQSQRNLKANLLDGKLVEHAIDPLQSGLELGLFRGVQGGAARREDHLVVRHLVGPWKEVEGGRQTRSARTGNRDANDLARALFPLQFGRRGLNIGRAGGTDASPAIAVDVNGELCDGLVEIDADRAPTEVKVCHAHGHADGILDRDLESQRHAACSLVGKLRLECSAAGVHAGRNGDVDRESCARCCGSTGRDRHARAVEVHGDHARVQLRQDHKLRLLWCMDGVDDLELDGFLSQRHRNHE